MPNKISLAQEAKETVQKVETDLAVLQVRFDHLDEKFDDVKSILKDLQDRLDDRAENTCNLVTEVKHQNETIHSDLSERIANLEKWRWMILGAAMVIGAMGMEGLHGLASLI